MTTLPASNTYSGNTQVNSGDLSVTGSLTASAVNAADTGTVSGTGTVQSLSIYGTLDPGVNGVGTLTADGNTTFTNSGAIFAAELDGTGAGSSNELLQASGTSVNLGTMTNLTVTQIVPTTAGQVFTIISGAKSITGTFAGLANNATFTNNGRTYQISYTASTVTLTDVTTAATVLHWIGGAGANGNLWNVAANWLEDTVPVSGDDLVFDTKTAGFSATANGFGPDNNITGLNYLTITIKDASAAGDFDLTGNAISLAGAGIYQHGQHRRQRNHRHAVDTGRNRRRHGEYRRAAGHLGSVDHHRPGRALLLRQRHSGLHDR